MKDTPLEFDEFAAQAARTLSFLDRAGGAPADLREGLELGCRVAAAMTADERHRARALSPAEVAHISRRAGVSEEDSARLFDRFART